VNVVSVRAVRGRRLDDRRGAVATVNVVSVSVMSVMLVVLVVYVAVVVPIPIRWRRALDDVLPPIFVELRGFIPEVDPIAPTSRVPAAVDVVRHLAVVVGMRIVGIVLGNIVHCHVGIVGHAAVTQHEHRDERSTP